MLGRGRINGRGFWRNLTPNKQVLLFITGVVVLIISIFSIWFSINVQPVNQKNNEILEIEIAPGSSIQQVAAQLNMKKLIKNNLTFIILSKLSSNQITAGIHEISQSMSTSDIVKKLNSISDSNYRITILPEMTISDIKDLLLSNEFTNSEIETAFDKKYNNKLLSSKPAELDLEGYIFPDTYDMQKKETVEDLLEKSFDHLYTKLSTDGSLGLINAKKMTIHEVLTLASIVTKEAPDEENQKKIAGVFWNRIDAGIPLGSDVTFQYAYKMGYCSENLPSCQSAWNTRIHKGLPPGPISNMTYSVIQAVLKPIASDNYYFVAGDDGTIYYSETEDEHNENVNLYCTMLCQ